MSREIMRIYNIYKYNEDQQSDKIMERQTKKPPALSTEGLSKGKRGGTLFIP